jgi:Ni,Fe-hydrogenase I large subunit
VTRIVSGPFNRVEGDLEVKLDVEAGRIQQAQVTAPMYRGFEQILHGKPPLDAMIIVPRICGICSVSQSIAAARALAATANIDVPENGAYVANLIHAVENVADHFTHFYLFFMPDFANPHYRDYPWYEDVVQRFRAIKGAAAAPVLQARAEFMHLLGLFAGKWPHSLTIQPAGVTHAPDRGELLRAAAMLASFRKFLEATLYGSSLEQIASLASVQELTAWLSQAQSLASDFGVFLRVAHDIDLASYGRGTGRLMSYGAYGFGTTPMFKAGVWDQEWQALDIEAITEDVSHAWLQGTGKAVTPVQGATLPDADKAGAYTWCKAPRLNGKVMEVGALARQVIDGQPLLSELFQQQGANVYSRIIARMIELARVVLAMESWLGNITPGAIVMGEQSLPTEAVGIGLTEAARGSLGHWLRIRNGRLLNYQIIAPTTWNFSPRDSEGTPGVLEQALQGTPIAEGDSQPVIVQHIVRSFDPCMVCTVH